MTMWRKARPVVLAVSLALNVALLSTWAAHALPARLAAAQPAEHTEVWCPLHRELDITPEQWRRIEPRLLDFHRRSDEERAALREAREELLDLLAAPQPDEAALRRAQQRILEGQGRMQQLVVRRIIEQKDVLTPEQQEKLFSLLRRRMECPGPGRMMGRPRAGTGTRPDERPGLTNEPGAPEQE